jgi:hypothetical protein
MLDPKGKADGLSVSVQVALGGWRQWPGDIFQWLRVWKMPGMLPNAAWVREDGKGGYEWRASLPDDRHSGGWQVAKTGQEARDAADDWLMARA